MLSSLLNLIEPTFLESSPEQTSQHGAFYVSQDTSACKPSETHNNERLSISLIKNRLPQEVCDMILDYDINRLLFLVKAAWHIRTSNMLPISIREERLTVTRVAIPSNTLRIHLIEVGGKTYIGRLSDTTEFAPGSLPAMRHRTEPEQILSSELLAGIKRCFKLRYRDYPLDGITYLAMKSDGTGLVDIAFRRSHGTPDWILNADTHYFGYEFSEIRYANVRDLLVVSDVGITPLYPVQKPKS